MKINVLLLILNFITVAIFALPPEKKTVFYQSVEWSHDGQSICFAAIILDSGKYVKGGWEIYIMKIDGTGLKKITENSFNDMWPSYSLDDKSLLFQSDRDGNQEIYSINVDGSSPKRITNSDGLDVYPVCSPDGNKILFVSSRDGNQELYLMNRDGSESLRLTNTEYKEFNPAWSTDGKKIVYYCEKGDRKDQIYMCNSDGSNPVNVTNDSMSNIYPSFSYDGTEIIYQSSKLREKRVCILNTEQGKKRIILSISGFFNRFSPNGKKLASISSGWPQSEISICNVDGTGEKIISNKEYILGLDKK